MKFSNFEFCPKMGYLQCEFWEKYNFESVNFMKNAIMKA